MKNVSRPTQFRGGNATLELTVARSLLVHRPGMVGIRLITFNMNSVRFVVMFAVLAVCSAAGAQAKPKGKDGYTQVIKEALQEFDSGSYGEARVLFEQAHTMRPSARTLRGMGMTSFELKEYVRSEKELNASLVDLRQPLSEAQRHEVLALLLRLERYIGKLVVRTNPTTATITLDGSAVGVESRLDLGRHELSVQADGYRPLNRTLTIEGGKTQTLELKLTPLDLDPKSAQPVAAVGDNIAAPAAEGTAPVPAQTFPDDSSSGSVFGTWWFWTIVGVVAAGGVTAAVVLTSKTKSEQPLQGNTGATVQVLSWSR